jgi:hypothetical protein
MEQQTIIVEHKDGILEAGQICYCGLCNEPMGFLKTTLTFPFKILQFTGALENSSIGLRVEYGIPMSVHHATCGGDIFITLGQLTFTNPAKDVQKNTDTIIN